MRDDKRQSNGIVLTAAILACNEGGIGVDPTFLFLLLRRPVMVRFGFPGAVRAGMGTGGGRATPPSCWDGLDMAEEAEGEGGRKEGRVRERGGGERRYKAGCN